MADVTKVKIADGDPSGLVVCLSGILMHAEGYKPLVSVLAPYGDVIGFDYDPHKRMNMPELLTKVRQMLYEAQGAGRKVTLIGSSMGGMQVPFVVEHCRKKHPSDDLSWLRKEVIVDPPTGADTMIAVKPKFVAPVVASSLWRLTIAHLIARIKVGPKDYAITIPSQEVMRELAGSAMSDAEWKEWITATQLASLEGYSSDLQWSWTNWMITVGRDGSYAKALQSLRGLNATYIAAVSPWNDVVAQPQAVEWHLKQCPTLKRIDIAAAHCGGGYWQNQPEYATAFASALAD